MAPHSATSLLAIFLFFSSSPTFIGAQGRAPHGLVYEGPVAFSPSAVEFFHPNKQQHPEAAQVAAAAAAAKTSTTTTAEEQSTTTTSRSGRSGGGGAGRSGLGAGGIAGIVFGVAFAMFVAMAAYYVVSTRRANLSKASSNSVQPHV